MPGVIGQPTAIGTLPHSLSTKFTESHSVLMNINEYHDGASQRKALVTSGRRTWKSAKRLDPVDLGLLRDFFDAAKSGAFYFFNPSETVPPYSPNPGNTAGRYLVRFNSDWNQTNGMSRSDCEIELIEVSDAGATDIGAPITHPGPGGPGDGGGTTTLPTLVIVPIDATAGAGDILDFQFHRSYGPISYAGLLWSYGTAGGSDVNISGGVYKSEDGETWTRQSPDTNLGGFSEVAYWDKNSATITFLIPEPASRSYSLVNFDMASSTYGEPSATVLLQASTPAFDQQLWHINLFRLSNGSWRVMYGVVNIARDSETLLRTNTGAEIYFIDYSGAAWTSPTLIAGDTGTFYTLCSAIQDGDVVHVVYGVRSPDDANGDDLPWIDTGYQYIRVAADGSMTSAFALDGILGSDGSAGWSMNTGTISGNAILIPTTRAFYDDPTVPAKMGVLVGSPKNDPTFTYVSASSALDLSNPDRTRPADMKVIHIGSTDYLAWLPHSTQIYLTKSLNGGATWSAPQVLLDIDATPPPSDPDQDTGFMINFSLGTDKSGTSLGLMYTGWASYWTNAPALL